MRALARARLLVRTWGGGGMGAGAKARDGVPGGVGGIGCGQADAAGLRAGDGRGAGSEACGGGGERIAGGVVWRWDGRQGGWAVWAGWAGVVIQLPLKQDS